MFIHNGPSHELGLPFIGPRTWIRQAHLIEPVKLYFYPLQLPPSPHGSVILERKDQWGDGSKLMGWQFKGLWVDGFSADVVNCANVWQVVWKSLWRMTRVVLWLDFISDRSVALSSVHFPIHTRVYFSHFFIFSCNILLECNRHPCQRPPCAIFYICRQHISFVQLLHPSTTHFLHSYMKNW